ncbi:MAG: hypothetical protein WC856_06665 [Methylococcaceae bacterium]|jgi:hypothetical protein
MISISRKIIKNYLERLPYGLGVNFVIPILKRVYELSPLGLHWNVGRRINLRRKIKKERSEAEKIINALNNDSINEVIIIYDYHVSPPTYGDFLLVVMLARYFVTHNIKVFFYIVDSEYRVDWSPLDEVMRQNRAAEQLEITDIILNKPMVDRLARIEVGSWSKIQSTISKIDHENILIPFKERVLSRIPIYNSCFNVINHLMAQESKAFCNQFLLSFDEFATRVKFTRPKPPYITWHCRYSKIWGEGQNTSEPEIINIINKMKAIFPHHAIMIVSDALGCSYFKTLTQRNGINVLFSKDYSATFLGDGALILGSDYYFQLRGGGIGVFVYFSKLPCDYYTPMAHEIEWSEGKATSWATEKQIIKKIALTDKRIYLPNGLIKTERHQ